MSDVRGLTEVDGIKEYRYFAGGEWRTAENHKLFDVCLVAIDFRRAHKAIFEAEGEPQ
jgi:hypothetical protein